MTTFREYALNKTNATERYEVGEEFISVTDFISVFETPFKREMISNMAFKANKNELIESAQELRFKWDLHGEIARAWGTAFHGVMESWVKYRERVKNSIFDKWINNFDNMLTVENLESEVEVRSEKLKVVGRIDLINVLDVDKKICNLIDIKTYSDPKKKITYLKDVWKVATKSQKFQTALQLSLYKKILEESGWTVNKLQVLLQDGEDLRLEDLENDTKYIERLIELIDTEM